MADFNSLVEQGIVPMHSELLEREDTPTVQRRQEKRSYGKFQHCLDVIRGARLKGRPDTGRKHRRFIKKGATRPRATIMKRDKKKQACNKQN